MPHILASRNDALVKESPEELSDTFMVVMTGASGLSMTYRVVGPSSLSHTISARSTEISRWRLWDQAFRSLDKTARAQRLRPVDENGLERAYIRQDRSSVLEATSGLIWIESPFF